MMYKYPYVNILISRVMHKINRTVSYISHLKVVTTDRKQSIVRPMIEYIHRNNKHQKLVGAEIGVQYGLNMRYILDYLPIERLYLIEPHPASRLMENLKETKGKTILIEKFSEDAIDDIPNNLDFVYIDGNHDYKFVKKDIELYYPKVKQGGVIGGHDYTLGHPGLVYAVSEFILNFNLSKCFHLSEDWWVIKK